MVRHMLPIVAALMLAGCTSSGGTPSNEAMPLDNAMAMTAMPMPDGRMFDPHSVPLYPGSTMAEMRITAHDAPDDMAFAFVSPAPLADVSAWFAQNLPAKGYHIAATPTGFAGTDPKGDGFKLDLAQGKDGTTSGTITAGN